MPENRIVQLAQAEAQSRAGQLVQAERLYREVLSREPSNAQAHHGLAMLLLQRGDLPGACDHGRKAVEHNPTEAGYHVNLGVLLKRQGLTQEAIRCYQSALELDPGSVAAGTNLGRALRETGQLDAAIAQWRHVVEQSPTQPNVWSMLSNALREARRPAEALEAACTALRLEPDLAEAHLNESAVLQVQGKLPEALVSCFVATLLKPALLGAQANLRTLLAASPQDETLGLLRTLLVRPDDAGSLVKLAKILHQQRRFPAAIACLGKAVALAPSAPLHRDLGASLLRLGCLVKAGTHLRAALELHDGDGNAHWLLATLGQRQNQEAEAETSFRRAHALLGDNPKLLAGLGSALQRQGKCIEATTFYRRALALNPKLTEATLGLAVALSDQAAHDQAAEAYRQGVALAPDSDQFLSAQLFAMHFAPSATPQTIFEAHQAFGRRMAGLRPTLAHPNPPDPEKRLRIGYVSPDFRGHPVSYFFEPVLAAHDPAQVEVFCYADVGVADAVTARLRRMAVRWRDSTHLSAEGLASLVREDRIDILVDLAGHTGGNRLAVFARKPAPVQVSWLGYFDTTGLGAIDFRIADHHSIPKEAERWFVEEVWRLPRTANCYLPPQDADVAPPPFLRNGTVTFGCFNNPAKIGRPVVRTFARILQRVEGSRLVLKYGAFSDPAMKSQYLNWFAEEGLGPGRIELREHSSMRQFLASFADIDIALDPYPYSGETTALHTLWMGVPLVTLEGQTLVHRLASRVLRVAGLASWVAADESSYVDLAVAAAGNPQALVELRAGLRARLQRSPLMDYQGVTRDLEGAYRSMWERWCLSRLAASETR